MIFLLIFVVALALAQSGLGQGIVSGLFWIIEGLFNLFLISISLIIVIVLIALAFN